MKTYKFFTILFSFCFLISCDEESGTIIPETEDIPGCTDIHSFNYNPSANVNDGSCKSMKGCLGYTGSSTNSGTLGTSLGDTYYDTKMAEEVAIQRSFWQGVPTEFWILYEPIYDQRNAWADSRGRILFGRHFFYSILGEFGELPIAGVLAHEFGHRAQQHFGFQYPKAFYQELEADAFSGFYMAMVKQWSWNNIQSYFNHVYSSGDTNFNSPTHHGTHNERLQSAYLGVNVAISALNMGYQYSYGELHQLFLDEIVYKIAPRTNKELEFEEVIYPKDLDDEYLRSLFPRIDGG